MDDRRAVTGLGHLDGIAEFGRRGDSDDVGAEAGRVGCQVQSSEAGPQLGQLLLVSGIRRIGSGREPCCEQGASEVPVRFRDLGRDAVQVGVERSAKRWDVRWERGNERGLVLTGKALDESSSGDAERTARRDLQLPDIQLRGVTCAERWLVLEQDLAITGSEPPVGAGPALDVAKSIEYLSTLVPEEEEVINR